jgi:hypothetical protein
MIDDAVQHCSALQCLCLRFERPVLLPWRGPPARPPRRRRLRFPRKPRQRPGQLCCPADDLTMATRAAELRVAIRELNDRCLYASVKWSRLFPARYENAC